MKRSFLIPLYHQRINFVDSIEDARGVGKPKTTEDKEWFDELEQDILEGAGGGACIVEDDCSITILVPEKNESLLVHEILHATFYTLIARGMKPSMTSSGQEPFCYLAGYLREEWERRMGW